MVGRVRRVGGHRILQSEVAHKNPLAKVKPKEFVNVDEIVFSDDSQIQRKVQLALQGQTWGTYKAMLGFSQPNMKTLAEYLNYCINEENVKAGTRRAYIFTLLGLSRWVKQTSGKDKPFKEFVRDDIITFLQSKHKSIESDPDQSWIRSNNLRVACYSKFFKWLYFPDIDRKKLKEKPEVIRDLPLIKPPNKTPVKSTDLWEPDEDKIFLKYCPDKRLQLYHTQSDDTSGRPHELLALRIEDIKIKNTNNVTYAELEIGRAGKTKGRIVPMINSLPYFKAMLAVHPEPGNPKSYLYRSFDKVKRNRNAPLTVGGLRGLYSVLKSSYFRSLLERPDVPPEDKQVIQRMLQKPWNPYIRRHTSLTEKARIVTEYTLRLHAGWTKGSDMVSVYTHELGGESSKEILAAYKILPKSDSDVKMDMLRPKVCTNCNEPNKPDARFCANIKCNLPLTFDAYQEAKEKEAKKEAEHDDTKKKLDIIQQQLDMLLADKVRRGEKTELDNESLNS